jgi:hypothetical protein
VPDGGTGATEEKTKMAFKDMSEEQIQAVVDGGYRAAGNIFRCMMDALEARYGKEAACAIGDEVVRLKSLNNGALGTSRFGKGGLANLRAFHAYGFPEVEILEFSPNRYVIRDHHCAIVEGWRKFGLSEERIKELGEVFCVGDLYVAQCFNPNIQLEFQGRLAEGKPYCQWAFTLNDE